MYVPTLDPYPGYTSIESEVVTDAEYDELPEGELIFPERQANIFSSMYLHISKTFTPVIKNVVDGILLKNASRVVVKRFRIIKL